MLESDPSGSLIVKVIDYGIAKILNPEAERGAEQTQTGFIGTPAFASPSSSLLPNRRRSITRSDIYSLGATFWYLLSGRVPFVGRTLRDVAAKQAEELPLEQLKTAHVPARVIALLQSMLAVDSSEAAANSARTSVGNPPLLHKIQARKHVHAGSDLS